MTTHILKAGTMNTPVIIPNPSLIDLVRKCLPGDLPAFIEVDLKDLESGQSIHVSQLALPRGVEVVHHGEGDPVVATIMHKGGGAAVEEEAAPAAVVAPAPAKPEKKAERVDKR